MDTPKVVQISIIAVLIWITVMVFVRKRVERQLLRALNRGDQEKYHKIVLNPLSIFLLEPNRIRMLRAICYLDLSDVAKAKKQLEVVNLTSLQPSERLMYLNAAISIGLNTHDEEYYKNIEERIEYVERDFTPKKLIEDLHRDYKINKKMYFHFDETVIKDIKKIVDSQKGPEKGLTMITLAKAYHFAGKEDKVDETLSEAINLAHDTGYDELFKTMLEDHSLLD